MTNADADPASLAERLGVDPAALAEVLPGLSAWRRSRTDQSTVDGWRYRIDWQPVAEPSSAALTGRWLVVGTASQDAATRAIADGLAETGADVLRIDLDTTRRDKIADALRAAVTEVPPAGVVSLLALGDQPCAASIPLVQALGDAEIAAPLWCVTTGAVTAGADDGPAGSRSGDGVGPRHGARPGPAGAVGWPGRPAGRQPRLGAPPVHRTVRCGQLGEDQLAVRAGRVLARRMTPAAADPVDPSVPLTEWRPRGTVLVTGGTGGIGAHLARWLAGNGAPHLLLTSRRGGDAPGAAELTDELTALGARVTVAACDVADRDALAALLDSIPEQQPLTAVLHAASALPVPTPLSEHTVEEFAQVCRAKIDGARHLDELTAGQELDAFVLFSSGASIWGSGLQAAYGAANAYLDALAHRRRAAGRVATSISWGAWGGDTWPRKAT